MKKLKLRMLTSLILLLATSVVVSQDYQFNVIAGEITNEVITPAASPSPNSFITGTGTHRNPNRVMTEINFDDSFGLPCSFGSVYPLQYDYEGYGVVFAGPSMLDGGAILDECSTFPATGYSPPNFLAFNTGGNLMSGGLATGPEDIYFNPPVSYMEIKAGCAAAGTIDMFAYDEQDNIIDYTQITATDPMQVISVSAERIAKVTIQFSGNFLVLDDMVFDTYLAPDNLEATVDPGNGNTDLSWYYAPINGVYEDFEDGNAQNWIPVTGYWNESNGKYLAENTDFKIASSFYNYTFNEFDLEVHFAKTAGSSCNVGIYFCGDPSSIGPNGGWLNGYHLVYCDNQSYNIARYDNGSATFIQDWTTSPNLNSGIGSYNTVRIVRSGGNIEAYFNGFYQGTWYDPTYLSGKIGLKLYDDNIGSGSAAFEYITIDPVADGFTFHPVPPDLFLKRFNTSTDYSDCNTCRNENYTIEPAPAPVENPYTHYSKNAFQNFNVYLWDNVTATPSIPNYSLTLPDFGLYGFNVTAQYIEGESNSTNHEMLWWLDQPIYTQIPYGPNDSWGGYTSDYGPPEHYLVYDCFTGLTELINGITFIGINAEFSSGWFTCNNEDPMTFEIKFYEDNAGLPGTEVASFTAEINRIETGMNYNLGDDFPAYEYRYYLPDPVDLANGWVSVQGISVGTPDCWFLWNTSPDGCNTAYQWNGISLDNLGANMAYALLGGWVPPPPTNLQANLTPATGRVVLTWQHTTSASRAFQYYKIYRNGTNIGITLNTGYEDFLPAYGSYDYEVTAFYDEGESAAAGPVNVNWTNVGVEEIDGEQVLIYPNPARDHLIIESAPGNSEVTIYNHFGQQVFYQAQPGNILKINTSSFATGVYLVKLSTNQGNITHKVIIR
ncbi:MAG: T9SS type A sorting domain-containing protein [Bacteroidetes bacterium]|nr:T9SS type A sorting domain-containing protein [Bacteroidota bacterium]